MHDPFSKEHNDTETAVMFIHGFMGSPNQFADLADDVYNKGYSYTSILLPGNFSFYTPIIKPASR